ncbi:MAG TPA: insulinase family protein, partial [Thermoanaerobaculia bacterium]|nr:insulinase family protein [Thermoanaerobaculia bacterium]
ATEVLLELRRIREAPVEPQELEDTISYIAGVFPYTFQTISDVAKRLETLAVYGLPDDYYDQYLRRLPTITREELLEVARRHIHPDHIAVVAVGPAETVAPQLEALGPVTVSAQA